VALRACLDATWNVTRAVVTHAFLPAGSSPPAGRIVYLAPAPSAGAQADAARAGLENLGRTLSIEWARHGITLITIAPGGATAAGEVAALTAYLASPAGAYFSGCLLDLRGP
jgi:NAD(P)-dependent dehydrogenase (short-subunit alcohol dehydrogenase family)